jgi:hypothetical protein
MNYIGNYTNWITPALMNHLETHTGDTTPVWQPDRWSGHPLLEQYKEMARAGYSHGTHVFQQFNAKSTDMKDFPIVLPNFPKKRNICHWWFVKLLPGQMQAMHIDPHLIEVKNPVRYTMFLKDFEPGHIFTYDDKMVSNYKAGDVYEWSDPMIVHGVVNIGYNIRYTLQVTAYDI